MLLLRFLYRQRNKLLIGILALAVAIIIVLPVLKGGTNSVFYSIDPDVAYVANALRYIKSGYITYNDHPGTPAIVLISIVLMPFKVYAKLFNKVPFIDWAYNNYSFTFVYLRSFESLLIFFSLCLLLSAIYKITKKNLMPFVFLVAVLLFAPFYYSGTSISAEGLSVLIASIWAYVLIQYLLNKKYAYLFLLSLIAGLAFANRATSFFMLPATLIPVVVSKSEFKQKVLMSLTSLVSMAVGFVVGVSPIPSGPISVLKQVFGYASSTKIHSTGGHAIINFHEYMKSAASYWYIDDLALPIFVLEAVVGIGSLFSKVLNKKILGLIVLNFVAGGIIFAKFPLQHYQLINYYLASFGATVLLSKYHKIVALFAFCFLFIIPPVALNYYHQVSLLQKNTVSIETFVGNQQLENTVVWQWSRTKEFAYLWTVNYSGGIFEKNINESIPKITNYNVDNINTFCWSGLFIQNTSLDQFLKSYPDYSSYAQKIQNTDMSFVHGKPCSLESK